MIDDEEEGDENEDEDDDGSMEEEELDSKDEDYIETDDEVRFVVEKWPRFRVGVCIHTKNLFARKDAALEILVVLVLQGEQYF